MHTNEIENQFLSGGWVMEFSTTALPSAFSLRILSHSNYFQLEPLTSNRLHITKASVRMKHCKLQIILNQIKILPDFCSYTFYNRLLRGMRRMP